MVSAVLLMALGRTLSAQVFEIKGGSSSLYGAQGGMLTMHAGSVEASGGLGMLDGRFTGGAQVEKKTARATYMLGSATIPFNLPTDIFDSDHYLTGIGLGIRTKAETTDIFVFAGETSTTFNNPFFDGAFADQPAVVLMMQSKLSPKLTADTTLLMTKESTMIESFDFMPKPFVRMAASMGLGSGHFYGASSLWIERPKIDVKAAYIAAGSQFRRADVTTPLTSEPDRENAMVTWRPMRNLSLSAARQNYLTPIAGTNENVRSEVNQVSGSVEIARVGLSATVFDSTYESNGDLALAVTANLQIMPRVNAQASFLESRPKQGGSTSSVVMNVQEELTPRWTISEMVNTSNGQTSVGFGGSFLSNRMSFSAEYQTYYVPERVTAPFEQALVMDAKLRLFGRLTIGAGTFVAPDGKLLYTSEVEGALSHELLGARPDAVAPLGGMVLVGRVVDERGEPVMGAALMVDQSAVYTDSRGYFSMRERKARRHAVVVLVHEFLNGGVYRVVSAPGTIDSSAGEAALETLIVVEAVTPGAE
jgi:hypothetical protein